MPNSENESSSGPASQIAMDLPNACIIDKYTLLEEMGRGANSIVYKARHVLLDQLVALKIIHAHLLSSPQAVKRFQNEATLLGSFGHPNIVHFASYGTLPDGRHYMALEYIEGKTLQQLLKDAGTLDAPRAVQIFRDIAAALAYAHSRGIVHRDVKPGNVMLTEIEAKETAKLLDFGIYKSEEAMANSETGAVTTGSGAIVGSANYMSPEQCQRQPVDARSDIYALGCLMYECLVGNPPMNADSELAIMSNHLNLQVDTVACQFNLPVELRSLILRCLRKDPSERFQTADELLKALDDTASVTLIMPSKRWRAPDVYSSVAAIVALALVLSIAVVLQNKYAHAPKLQVGKVHTKLTGRQPPQSKGVNDFSYALALDAWLADNIANVAADEGRIVDALSDDAVTRANFNAEEVPPSAAKIEMLMRSPRQLPQDQRLDHKLRLALAQEVCKLYTKADQTINEAELLAAKDTKALRSFDDGLLNITKLDISRRQQARALPRLFKICRRPSFPVYRLSAYVNVLQCYEALHPDPKEQLRVLNLAADAAQENISEGWDLRPIQLNQLFRFFLNHGLYKRAIALMNNEVVRSAVEVEDRGGNEQMEIYVENLTDAYSNLHEYSKAEAVLKNFRDRCLNRIQEDCECSCRAEFSYLSFLRNLHRSIKKELLDYLLMTKRKGRPDGSEYLLSLKYFHSHAGEQHLFDEDPSPQLVAGDIGSYESKLPLLCGELRTYEGYVYYTQNKFKQSLKALAQAEQDLKGYSTSTELDTLGDMYSLQMLAHSRLGNFDQVDGVHQEAQKKCEAYPKGSVKTEVSYANAIVTHDIAKAIAALKGVMNQYANGSQCPPAYYNSCAQNLCKLYENSKSFKEAEAVLVQALDLIKQYHVESALDAPHIYANLARVCREEGKSADASKYERLAGESIP